MSKTLFVIVCIFLNQGLVAQQKKNCHHFPIPARTEKRLFYLQRNLNANTVVYDANFDAHGWLDSENPVDIYWIRYEEKGRTMPLRVAEKRLAFGLKIKQLDASGKAYKVTLNATDKRDIYIRQEKPYEVTAFVKINGEEVPIDHIYVQSEGNKVYSKVAYIDLFGMPQSESTQTRERIFF
ncbi:MAG: hypothetical protein CSA96_04660 [Bacteroidetes bacterium]|nr:MAG: hypothetical protein CSA96_04660 [Bacteroidota bacterium]